MKFTVIEKPEFSLIRKGTTKVKVNANTRAVTSMGKSMTAPLQVSLTKAIKKFRNKIKNSDIYNAWKNKKTFGFGAIDFKEPSQIIETTFLSAGRLALPANDVKELRWDSSNPHVADYLETANSDLVKYISNDTRTVIRESVKNSYDNAWTPRDIAESIKGSIGLLPQHAAAVEKFRAKMSADGIPSSRALKLSNAYADRLLNYRAMNIAKTESRRAASYGQLGIWKTGMDQGLIPDGAEKIWVVSSAPCPICDPMDGESVAIDDSWELNNGESVEIPNDAHPSCECEMQLSFGEENNE